MSHLTLNSATMTNTPSELAQQLGKVAVLLGGHSHERDISLLSGQGVLKALQEQGVDAMAFDPAIRDVCELKHLGVARAFIALHGRGGEDGTIQGLLEWLGIAYTGSGVAASALAMHKAHTKLVWDKHGLPTPAWRMVSNLQEAHAAAQELGLPLLFKAAHEGSTLGIGRAFTTQEVQAAFETARALDAEVLAESFISGEEVTCAVLGEGQSARALPLIRIHAPRGNYDYEHKYFSDATRYECPCDLPAAEQQRIEALVLAAYRAVGCRGWGRADVMIRASDRQPFLIEINTAPGMTSHSLVPMAARAVGMDYGTLCVEILRHASSDAASQARAIGKLLAQPGSVA